MEAMKNDKTKTDTTLTPKEPKKPTNRRKSLYYIITRRGKNGKSEENVENGQIEDKPDTAGNPAEATGTNTCAELALPNERKNNVFQTTSALYPNLNFDLYNSNSRQVERTSSIRVHGNMDDQAKSRVNSFRGHLGETGNPYDRSNNMAVIKPYRPKNIKETNMIEGPLVKSAPPQSMSVVRSNGYPGNNGNDIVRWLHSGSVNGTGIGLNDVISGRNRCDNNDVNKRGSVEETMEIDGKQRRVNTVMIYKKRY